MFRIWLLRHGARRGRSALHHGGQGRPPGSLDLRTTSDQLATLCKPTSALTCRETNQVKVGLLGGIYSYMRKRYRLVAGGHPRPP
jgi:hypothetical protein